MKRQGYLLHCIHTNNAFTLTTLGTDKGGTREGQSADNQSDIEAISMVKTKITKLTCCNRVIMVRTRWPRRRRLESVTDSHYTIRRAVNTEPDTQYSTILLAIAIRAFNNAQSSNPFIGKQLTTDSRVIRLPALGCYAYYTRHSYALSPLGYRTRTSCPSYPINNSIVRFYSIGRKPPFNRVTC